MQSIARFAPAWAAYLCTLCLCALAVAEPKGEVRIAAQPVSRSAVLPPMYYETGRPLFSQVSHRSADAIEPGCGATANCCGDVSSRWDGVWNDYCCSKPRCHLLPCGVSLLKRSGCGCVSTSCNTCETCHTGGACDTCNSCNDDGCSGRRWGFQGCTPCCKPCYRPHCGPIRCWANGWCGETIDGYSAGHPPCPSVGCNCNQGGGQIESPMPSEAPSPAPPPMPPAEAAPAKTARHSWYSPVSMPRYSRGAVIK